MGHDVEPAGSGPHVRVPLPAEEGLPAECVSPTDGGRAGGPGSHGKRSMAEMNPISRAFVNAFSDRRGRRRYAWVSANLLLPPGAACLEIGCGNGGMAARLVDGLRPSRYIATDLDPRQLEAARRYLAKRYPGGMPPALALEAGDMLRLQFPDGAFDAVFAFTSIHHASPSHHDFSKVPEALTEIDRVLRRGGWLVYEEIVHRQKIAAWLRDHGYTVRAHRKRWTHEAVIAQKPG